MSYPQRGLHKVQQLSSSKLVAHFGILDAGNYLGYGYGVVIHLGPSGVVVEPLRSFGEYKIVNSIADLRGAIRRVHLAMQNPKYDLFENNCEHFVNSITTGRRVSGQLQGAVVLGVLAALFIFSRRAARV